VTAIQYIRSEPWTNLFHVSPSQFNIKCHLGKDKFLQLSIVNNDSGCIAWKLKTNRPGRYMVSPKQGVIAGNAQRECTVVLSKLKTLPDTKKPDKFLIQATKVGPATTDSDLPQLWRDRESKHDKKRSVFAFQAVTIKCYLDVTVGPLTPSGGGSLAETVGGHREGSGRRAESKQNEKVTIIEDYVSSESTADHESPSKTAKSSGLSMETAMESNRSTPIPEAPSISREIAVETEQKVDPRTEQKVVSEVMASGTAATADDDGQRPNIATDSALNVAADSVASHHAKEVEQWRRKAQEYDDLFQFTRKTLAQRDELNQRWKHQQEMARKFEKLNREMREEKKRILAEYTRFRNEVDAEDGAERPQWDDDEKRGQLPSDGDSAESAKSKRQRAKKASLREMEEMDEKAIRNSKAGLTVSIVHIVVTLLLMFGSYRYGQRHYVPLGGDAHSAADGLRDGDGGAMDIGHDET